MIHFQNIYQGAAGTEQQSEHVKEQGGEQDTENKLCPNRKQSGQCDNGEHPVLSAGVACPPAQL